MCKQQFFARVVKAIKVFILKHLNFYDAVQLERRKNL